MPRLGAALPIEQPQVRFSINQLPVAGATSLEIESVAYLSADRFRIELAIGASAETTFAYFSSLTVETITIEVAPYGFGYSTLLIGQIDNVRVDYLKNTALLSGRDLSARLIDAEISETFVNQTSSQIASAIAARHQLAANVTPTTTPVGQYYELDHARVALGLHARATTEWNLLTALAQLENFELSVSGTTLNFGPPADGLPIFVRPQSFISLSLDVATTLPTASTVKSWNTRQKSVIAATQGTGMGTTIVLPNLTSAQAQTYAANSLATLGRHTTILTGTMPGDVTTMPRGELVLSGTGSAFDMTYSIFSVIRKLDSSSGFIQTIYAYART